MSNCNLSIAAAKANRDASLNLQEQAHPSQHPLVRVDAIEPLDGGLGGLEGGEEDEGAGMESGVCATCAD